MSIKEAKHIHCIGIGGVGISALAGLLVSSGKKVTGTEDNESPKTLDPLRAEGVEVFSPEDELPVADVYVYSDAWKRNHSHVLEASQASGKEVLSYFEALGQVSKEYKTIAIAGTHGKTTTTAMLAGMIEDLDPTVIVGSVMRSTGRNVRVGKSDVFVVEACEYNDHFLELHPSVLVITNIELDHTDYFKDIEQLLASYRTLIARLPEDGHLILNTAGKYEQELIQDAPCKVVNYMEEEVPELLVPGEFNIENAKAAMAVARVLGDDTAAYTEALASFPGTWRRFEFRGMSAGGALVYDDYAHHPTAIARTIEAAKKHFPSKKVVIAFHPHLYSRTRSFLKEFGEALALADHVYIAPIFAAREEVDEEITNNKVVEEVQKAGGVAETISGEEDFVSVLEEQGSDALFISMGAGDIYKWIPESVGKVG